MITLSYLTAIHFKGTDAGEFLHNQLSSDILGLKEGDSTLACYCEPKGRVLSLMLVNCQQQGYYVILAKSLRDMVVKRLQMYILRAKVEIDILDGYGVAGTDTANDSNLEKAQPANAALASPPVATALATPPLASMTLPESTITYLLTETSILPDEAPDEQDAWKLAELQRGLSWLGTDTSGEFLPQFLGFDQIGAVNYRKGCYPGQEIVARTHYLGKVKRHPRLLCSRSLIGPNQMEKINILSGGESFSAVTVDYAFDEEKGNCWLVVTRMDPELPAEQVSYQDQTVDLI